MNDGSLRRWPHAQAEQLSAVSAAAATAAATGTHNRAPRPAVCARHYFRHSTHAAAVATLGSNSRQSKLPQQQRPFRSCLTWLPLPLAPAPPCPVPRLAPVQRGEPAFCAGGPCGRRPRRAHGPEHRHPGGGSKASQRSCTLAHFALRCFAFAQQQGGGPLHCCTVALWGLCAGEVRSMRLAAHLLCPPLPFPSLLTCPLPSCPTPRMQVVMKKALAHDGLARGLHESARAIERGQAQVGGAWQGRCMYGQARPGQAR